MPGPSDASQPVIGLKKQTTLAEKQPALTGLQKFIPEAEYFQHSGDARESR